jgi:hypothetical protein
VRRFNRNKEVTTIDPTTRRNPIEEKLAISAPLDFSERKHSFQNGLNFQNTTYR